MSSFDARKILWSHLNSIKNTYLASRSLADFLKKIPIFNGLSHWQRKKVGELLYLRDYEAGEHLFELDQPGAAVFLIYSGKVSVEVDGDDGSRVVLAELEAGSFIGELALLDQSPRSASARAIQPTQAFALLRSDLETLVERDPALSALIYRALATVVGDRLKTTNELFQREKAA
jgi:CRP-like cAMP-binding protein